MENIYPADGGIYPKIHPISFTSIFVKNEGSSGPRY